MPLRRTSGHCRHGVVAVALHRRRHRHRLDLASREPPGRHPAVVRVQVVGDDDAVEPIGGRPVAELLARAGGPVDPGRAVVGSRKRGGRALERVRAVRPLPRAVRGPADLPLRALRVAALREQLRELAEGLVGAVVLILEDVVRGEVVQRLLGPRVAWKRAHQRVGEADVLGVVAQLTHGAQVEELRFRAAARRARPGRQLIARALIPAQVVVGFGEAQRNELLVVARGCRLHQREAVARLRVALRAEQPLGAAQFQLVARGSRLDRLPRVERGNLRGRGRRQIAERILVVDVRVGLGRAPGISRRLPGARQAAPGVVGRQRDGLRQRLVERDGRLRIALRFGDLARKAT